MGGFLLLAGFMLVFDFSTGCAGSATTGGEDGEDLNGDDEDDEEGGGGGGDQATSNHPWPMFHGDWNHTGRAAVAGPSTNNQKWEFSLSEQNDNAEVGSIAISEDGTIYAAGDGRLVALDADGTQVWRINYANVHGPAISEDGATVYFLSADTIVAVNASDGSELWTFETGDDTIFGVTLGSDGVIYQGSWDHSFYSINTDGTQNWTYETEGCVSYPPTIDTANNFIYLGGGDANCGGGEDSNVYSFDADGNLRWTYDTNAMRVGSPAIGPDGLIYVPASPTLYVLNSDGELQWSSEDIEDDLAGIITPAIASDGSVIIGNSNGEITSINPDTQEVNWTVQGGADPDDAGNSGIIGFPVVDSNGTVYVGSVDHNMYAIDSNGNTLWTYDADARHTESSPAIGADGTLYFTTEDGKLHAVGE